MSTISLELRNKGKSVIFNINPAQIESINTATGLKPLVFTINPLQSLPDFLRMTKQKAEQMLT